MRFNNLNDWLTWQESLNPKEIELGLERVSAVLKQAGLSATFNCPLITVAGTNGKGSVVAMLEAMAMSAGLNVCSYTSPHLFRYNERIKINSQPVSDGELCEAFERLDKARGDYPLTYFEFGTLAAIDLFFKQQPDLVILEVGLGGRLDAVNIMDADISILTSIAIDHIDWLGDDREVIGYEKAGVFRTGKPVVCGEREVPVSVVSHAAKLNCELIQLGRDYEVDIDESSGQWQLNHGDNNLSGINQASLVGRFQYDNAATATMALQILQTKGLLAPEQENKQFVRHALKGLKQVKLSGRFQRVNAEPQVFVDVAHNLQAAEALASLLKSTRHATGKTWAILAMLADKDVKGVIEQLSDEIDHWCFAGLEAIPRGLSVNDLSAMLPEVVRLDFSMTDNLIKKTKEVNPCKMLPATALQADSVTKACEKVLLMVDKNDRIVIFGSFYTVAEAMQYFDKVNNNDAESIN
jgi:dihydrofolate synthase/folylpolyglutamate synthase